MQQFFLILNIYSNFWLLLDYCLWFESYYTCWSWPQWL